MDKYDMNASLAELFGLSPEECGFVRLAETSLPPRVVKCLRKKNIRTKSKLLQVNSNFLMKIRGFGTESLNEVYSFLSGLPKDERKEKNVERYNENVSFAELFGLSPEKYTHIRITKNMLPKRVVRQARQEGIETLSEFLGVNGRFILNLRTVGQNSLNDVYTFLELLVKCENIEIYNEDASFAVMFGLIPEKYRNIRISEFLLPKRVVRQLRQENIRTVEKLLAVNSRYLMQRGGFNQTSLNEIRSFLDTLPKEKIIEEGTEMGRTVIPTAKAREYKNQIFNGEFSFIETEELREEEKNEIRKYQDAYEMIGGNLVENCQQNPNYISDLMQMLHKYSEKADRYAILRGLMNQIPLERRANRCKGYITTFSLDIKTCKELYQCYANEDAALDSMFDFIDIENDTLYNTACGFLMWCTFNLSREISELFCKLYAGKKTEAVIGARAGQHTLDEIAENLQITRERVRQIEQKARVNFTIYQNQRRILEKICADYNGKTIITQEEISKLSGENADALNYMLKNTKSSIYLFDEQLNAFVIGDTDISVRTQNYVDSLPEKFRRKKLQEFLEFADRENLDLEHVKGRINDTYTITRGVYCKTGQGYEKSI